MSSATRWRKVDRRRQARWAERRQRLLAEQSTVNPLSAEAVILAFDLDPRSLFFCDGERAAREWCRDHPMPLPHGLGVAYRARRRGSW